MSIRLHQAEWMLLATTLIACDTAKVQQAPQLPASDGTTADFSATSTASADDQGTASPASAATSAAAANAITINEQMSQLNAAVDRDQSQLEIAQQNKVTLEDQLTSLQSKGISSNTGDAIGDALAASGEIALGVFSSNIFALGAGVITAGEGIGAGIAAIQQAQIVNQTTSEVQAELTTTNGQIAALKNQINQYQGEVSTLIKEGAQ